MEFEETLYCCNPFEEVGHKRCKKDLRNVQLWMVQKISGLNTRKKICGRCRKKLSKLPGPSTTKPAASSKETGTDGNSSSADTSTDENTLEAKDVALEALNDTLTSLGESPVKKKRLKEKKYPEEKFSRVGTVLKSNYVSCPESKETSVAATNPEFEIISQLKDKFHQTQSKSEKIQILTILPKSWSIRKIEKEFGASNFLVRKAKQLVQQHGILATPNPKYGSRTLNENIANQVRDFFNSDEVSRCLPGKKDFVSIRENGVKVHKQKRLVLGNLKEVYKLFKERNPNVKVGVSKFCDLRPKNCVLAGVSGTHNVCVCSIHQNVKLMLEGCGLKELTSSEDIQLTSYNDCIAQIICNPPHPQCYLSSCESCPGVNHLTEYIANLFDASGIDEVTYKIWTSTDRTTLQTVVNSAEEFLEILDRKFQLLLPHSFIASQQSIFLSEMKNNLADNEFLIICDFAENYSFILQDEVQGFHWNNAQATIHPFVAYYKNYDTLAHISYVVISECLHHDTVSVHLFQRCLIKFLTNYFNRTPKHIYYFSDGSAAQYKNKKNFINLCYHHTDFNVTAEWHFFATSHGKGPCDGIAGTVKRLAARASLQNSYGAQIMTPRQLFEWCSKNITMCQFCYTTNIEYDKEVSLLQQRFEDVRTIAGTQKLHCVIPSTLNSIKVKVYSNSDTVNEAQLRSEWQHELELHEISGFVACMYDGHWWLGCVLNVDEDRNEVKISFLHPCGPSSSFKYPQQPDILNVDKADILTKVDVTTPTGRTYFMSPEDLQRVEAALARRY